jgi:aldose 1-epimerase
LENKKCAIPSATLLSHISSRTSHSRYDRLVSATVENYQRHAAKEKTESMKAKLCIPLALGLTIVSCSSSKPPAETSSSQPSTIQSKFKAEETNVTVGGKKAVRLSQPQSSDTSKPQILSADILPGRGMNIFKVKAYVPGKGVIDVLFGPPLEQATELMNNGPADQNGNGSYGAGGAILVPFANRIRGKMQPDGKTIEATILGKTVSLVANTRGKKPKAEPHAMHGLILNRPMDTVSLNSTDSEATVDSSLDAGNFGGHWLSKSNVEIKATLNNDGFGFTVNVKNTGEEDEPVGIGWHPYFAFPSGQREQAKLYVPAKKLALVNNYDDVFPTGKLVPMKGKYAFNQKGGLALDHNFYDDCFVDLEKDANGHATAEIVDPAAKYGVRVIALSPEISAFQAYAPPTKEFVAFEPQFNWGDPFGKEWKGQNTGMVTLKPGQSVTYAVQIQVFVP